MPDQKPDTSEALLLRAKALSRWENEGGAEAGGHQQASITGDQPAIREFTKNELVHMLTRLIALENLVISLLSDASEQQLERVREMAAFISPRPGATPHPLTIHAAAHMIDMVNRSNHFRGQDHVMDVPPASIPYKCTPVFNENTLPAGLRREHRTKAGVWGVIRVIEGRVRFQVLDPASERLLEPGRPGLVLPDTPHLVEPLGPMLMQVEFYDRLPHL
jgi:tellurite resistance-related uncharacterized protein